MKAYLIAFDPMTANLPLVHKVITSNNHLKEWWHYISGTYIITSNSNIKIVRDSLIKDGLSGGWFLIIEVKKNSDGLLPEQAWDWINTKIDQ